MSQIRSSPRSTIRLAALTFPARSRATISRITKGLKSSIAISRGTPHWYILSVGPTAITERPEKSTRLPSKFWRKRPCLPLSIWLNDFKGRLPGPVIGRPRRPLSISASTASCNIRFSF